jgi:kynurenine 3-monooxygenase
MDKGAIHIIGAGLVGSLWAFLLKQKGFDVHVFEKRADPRLAAAQRGRSINLIVTSRGLNGLKKAGLAESILPSTVPVYGRLMHSLDGATQYQAYGRNNSECNYAVSRGDLNKKLIQKCTDIGVSFHFEQDLTDIDLSTKTLRFGNGASAVYNRVFATDGAGSIVRKKLHALNPAVFKENVSFISSDYKELYLPAGVDGKPVLEKNNLHIWPRGTHMLMALANTDNSFTLTLYLPRTNHPWSFDSLTSAARVRELFTSEFKDVIGLVPDLESQFLENPQGSLGTVRFSQWHYEDSVAVMGDAAHAIVPFFGQGMNCGFEDVSVLLEILEKNSWDFSAGLLDYSSSRIENANAIADMALENFVEMSDKVGDQNFLLQKKIESILEKEFPLDYRSRYGMITYTLIPYAKAQEAGRIQSRLLASLADKFKSIEAVDLAVCKQEMDLEWTPWLKTQGFSLERFVV